MDRFQQLTEDDGWSRVWDDEDDDLAPLAPAAEYRWRAAADSPAPAAGPWDAFVVGTDRAGAAFLLLAMERLAAEAGVEWTLLGSVLPCPPPTSSPTSTSTSTSTSTCWKRAWSADALAATPSAHAVDVWVPSSSSLRGEAVPRVVVALGAPLAPVDAEGAPSAARELRRAVPAVGRTVVLAGLAADIDDRVGALRWVAGPAAPSPEPLRRAAQPLPPSRVLTGLPAALVAAAVCRGEPVVAAVALEEVDCQSPQLDAVAALADAAAALDLPQLRPPAAPSRCWPPRAGRRSLVPRTESLFL